jgi:hypothetical protein
MMSLTLTACLTSQSQGDKLKDANISRLPTVAPGLPHRLVSARQPVPQPQINSINSWCRPTTDIITTSTTTLVRVGLQTSSIVKHTHRKYVL